MAYKSDKTNAAIRSLSPAEWAKFDALHGPRQPNGCIPWGGRRNKLGRAVFSPRHSTSVLAGRCALYRETGVLGEVAMHGCDNPACVSLEPGHLRWATQAENLADMTVKGRRASGAEFRAKCRAAHKRGPASHAAKLTANDITAIEAELAKGTSRKQLAVQFGVSKTTIQGIAVRQVSHH